VPGVLSWYKEKKRRKQKNKKKKKKKKTKKKKTKKKKKKRHRGGRVERVEIEDEMRDPPDNVPRGTN